MKSRIHLKLSSLSLLPLLLLSASAQPAAEFFHGGAQRFLTNNIPGALEVVTNGLQRFPEDEKLKKLYELLNRQQQQQQQQDQKQQEQNEQKQDDSSKSEDQKKDDQGQQDSGDKQKPEEKDKQQAKSGEPSKDQPGAQQPRQAQMTPQEAKQLLDEQKGDEQVLIFQPQGEPKNRTKRLKDW